MTKPNYCHTTIVVDRSGSMKDNGKATEATNGIKSLMEDQFALPGDFTLTLTQFDTGTPERVAVMTSVPVKYELVPRGGTALLDAVALEIIATGKELALMAEDERPSDVVFVIVTDGEENSSHNFDLDQVKEMIQHQQDAYGWKFLFLGADTAAWLGKALHTDYSTSYTNDQDGTHAVYAASSSYLTTTRSMGASAASMPENI